MRIYNGTKSTLNVPMANGARLVIRPFEASNQFLPTVELLQLFVSAYSREDIAIIIESAAELTMGSMVTALPGYVANSLEEAIMRFRKPEDSVKEPKAAPKPAVKAEVKSKDDFKSADSVDKKD